MTEKGFIGVVCALQSEAKAVRFACDSVLVEIGVSGANADRAEKIARDFCQRGCAAILSVGISGGLDPTIKTADLIIGEKVISTSGDIFPTESGMLEDILSAAAGDVVRRGALLGSDEIIVSVDLKSQLFKSVGAMAVDMESHRVAAVAQNAGVPFGAVRAIADAADRAMPAAAMNAVAPDGSTQVGKVLQSLLRSPRQIPAIMSLGVDASAADKSVRTALRPILARLLLRFNLV